MSEPVEPQKEAVTSAVAVPLPELPPDVTIEGMLSERYAGQDERDIFAKTGRFKLIDQARELDIYPFFQALDNNDGPEAEIYGQRVLMFGSNNYLGQTRPPGAVDPPRPPIQKYGPSMPGWGGFDDLWVSR